RRGGPRARRRPHRGWFVRMTRSRTHTEAARRRPAAPKGRSMNPRVGLIVDELARHRRQFEALCRSLDADELATPVPDTPWTVQDYIAHLATIDGLVAHNFQRLTGMSDVPPPDIPPTDPFDIDDWNAAAVAARRGVTVEQLLTEAAGHRDNLVRAL